MRSFEAMPKAIFGDNLWGTKAMRFLFMDEAGTSGAPHEIVRVVATIIVDADSQLLRAEAALKEVLGAVPDKFAKNFIFHAEEIWGSPRFRDDAWPMTDRKLLLESVMAIPRRLGLPIAFGICWADTPLGPVSEDLGLAANEEQYFFAFRHAVTHADRWIRNKCDPEEIGTIVAENTDMKVNLGRCLKISRSGSFTHPKGMLAPTDEEQRLGYVKQDGTLRVTRTRPTIHWVEKGDDPLVWLADACAFGLKRFFAEKDFGLDFCTAIMGGSLNLNDYKRGPCSGGYFPR